MLQCVSIAAFHDYKGALVSFLVSSFSRCATRFDAWDSTLLRSACTRSGVMVRIKDRPVFDKNASRVLAVLRRQWLPLELSPERVCGCVAQGFRL